MTETESTWAARVMDWRSSGQTAPVFCKGKGFSPSGLRYWATRLRRVEPSVAAPEVRLARVVRVAEPTAATVVEETPIVVEVGQVRLAVRRGFAPEALRAVLDVLGGRL